MEFRGVSEAELARSIGIPQATLNKILLGNTEDPRASTLSSLSSYFKVSIGQLAGTEPLNNLGFRNSKNIFRSEELKPIPLIDWEKIASWNFERRTSSFHSFDKWVVTEQIVSDFAFAVKTRPSMRPIFREKSILIADPSAQYDDGNYVLVSIDGHSVSVRKLLRDGAALYLLPLQTSLEIVKLEDSHKVLGVIIEEKMNYS